MQISTIIYGGYWLKNTSRQGVRYMQQIGSSGMILPEGVEDGIYQ